jgi:hypothetical protein
VIATPAVAGISIRVFSPQGQEAGIVGSIGAQVKAAGFEVAGNDPVPFEVRERHVRFYHAADSGAAARLATALGIEARDFTDFRPAPAAGHVEVWLAGSPSSPTVEAAKPQVTPKAKPTAKVAKASANGATTVAKAAKASTKAAKAAAKAAKAPGKKRAAATTPQLSEAQQMQRLREGILWQLRNPGP